MYKALCVLAVAATFTACVDRTETKTSVVTQQGGDTASHAPAPVQQPAGISAYRLVAGKDSVRMYLKQQGITPALLAANRADSANVRKLDTLLVPADAAAAAERVSPFPADLPFMRNVAKVVYFSYPAQYFAAYEHGQLKYTGPTNMGRQKDPTPTGLYFTNWKAEETKSSFNDEWELKWNFNIENKEGIGWHQYVMPGYPASHSCLRLMEADAKNLYQWADEWVMKGGKTTAQGTPVIVFGVYPFGGQKPWYGLAQNARALDLSAAQLEAETKQHMQKIMAEEQRRKG